MKFFKIVNNSKPNGADVRTLQQELLIQSILQCHRVLISVDSCQAISEINRDLVGTSISNNTIKQIEQNELAIFQVSCIDEDSAIS